MTNVVISPAEADCRQPEPRIRDIVQHLTIHPDDNLAICDLAQRCHMSESRLSHLFVEQVRKSPGRFRSEMRMQLAEKLLLETDLPIKEIAAQVGLPRTTSFIRRFKKHWGVSPRAFRRTKAPAMGST